MMKRRPTLSLKASSFVPREDVHVWMARLSGADFNVLRIDNTHALEGVRALVEASVGLVAINRAIELPGGLSCEGLGFGVRTAHELGIPVYLTGQPSESQKALSPFTVLDDRLIISRQWPPSPEEMQVIHTGGEK